jgi:hypothetical protein
MKQDQYAKLQSLQGNLEVCGAVERSKLLQKTFLKKKGTTFT